MTDMTIPTGPDELAETPERVRARLDRLRAEADQRQAEREAASRPALTVDQVEGMPSRAQQNVLADAPKPTPTDADHRLIAGLAAIVRPGAELEADEVRALRTIEQKQLDPSDQIIVKRLLAPTVTAEQAAYDAAEPERKAVAEAGAKSLKRGVFDYKVKALMQPPSAGGEGLSRSQAEAKARTLVYGR